MKSKAYLIVAALSFIAPSAFGSEGVIMRNIQQGLPKISVANNPDATAKERFRFAMSQYKAEGRLRKAIDRPNENGEFTYVKLNDRLAAENCAVSSHSLTDSPPTLSFNAYCQE
jgi:hypothetical protein